MNKEIKQNLTYRQAKRKVLIVEKEQKDEQLFTIGDDLLRRIGDALEKAGELELLAETRALDFAE